MIPDFQNGIENLHGCDSDSPDSLEQVVPGGSNSVTFFPSLHDTRRAWLLSKLRENRIASVLDVGCGAGSLLSRLCNPAPFFKTSKDSANEKTDSMYSPEDNKGLPDLHISQLSGLDISKHVLEKCLSKDASIGYRNAPRWECLEIKIWLGSLDVYNPEFVGIECIVASEVIEHLPATILSAFAPTLLGQYRPRILLVTTPNYTFNARFSAPGKVDEAGYIDPTGRTTRVFRHHDHKFEWTPSEFKEWCEVAAREWGYAVGVGMIGFPMEPDPWGRDEELGRASQVAIFQRKDEWQGQPPIASSPSQGQAHVLLKSQTYLPHPCAGLPESTDRITELVSRCMESYYFEEGYKIWDLWVDDRVPITCGGRLDDLLRSIDNFSAFSLTKMEGLPEREWIVKFAGDKHQEALEKSKTKHFWERISPRRIRNHGAEQGVDIRDAFDARDPPDPPTPTVWYEFAKEYGLGREDIRTMMGALDTQSAG